MTMMIMVIVIIIIIIIIISYLNDMARSSGYLRFCSVVQYHHTGELQREYTAQYKKCSPYVEYGATAPVAREGVKYRSCRDVTRTLNVATLW